MNKTIYALLLLISFAHTSHAKVIDKIVAIFDDQIVTLSEIQRIKKTLKARSAISEILYPSNKMSINQIVEHTVNTFLVKSKLNELGYIISDDDVEERIKPLEKRSGLSRQGLINNLEQNGIKFNEYFEIIRSTIEYNIFLSRVIRPLIAITEQEIKNEFYKKYGNKRTTSTKYNLVDFSIKSSKAVKKNKGNLQTYVKRYKETGNLPRFLKKLDIDTLDEISDENLLNPIRKALKNLSEGEYSKPVMINGYAHIFYLKKRSTVESELFLEKKNFIMETLLKKEAKNTTNVWFQRESNKHYIKKL